MSHFIPPAFNLPTAWAIDAIAPAFLKTAFNIEEVHISSEDRKMIRKLRDDRLLYFSNHPTQTEPTIAWFVANAMGIRFHSMATRRAFDFGFGLVGKVLQAGGGFSVIPGIADRDSMAMARKILSSPGGKLTLYPEGEPMSSENDNLMPFQPGIVKIGLSALEDARKKDPNADIKILPAFIKYIVKPSRAEVVADLERGIAVIAKKLKVDLGARNLLRRFLMIGRILMEQTEQDLGLESEKLDWDYRTGRLRHALLDRVADRLKMERYDRDADAIQKLRFLTAVLELEELKHPQSPISGVSAEDLRWANQAVIRAYDFIVMRREYLVSYPSAERFYEWLARFESLVLGKRPRMLGGEPSRLPRDAYVSFAKPFALGEYFDDYRGNRKETLNKILERIHDDMSALLEKEIKRSEPIVEPYDVGE